MYEPNVPILSLGTNNAEDQQPVDVYAKVCKMTIFFSNTSEANKEGVLRFAQYHVTGLMGGFCPRANYWGNSQNIFITYLNIHQSNDRNIFNRYVKVTDVRKQNMKTALLSS